MYNIQPHQQCSKTFVAAYHVKIDVKHNNSSEASKMKKSCNKFCGDIRKAISSKAEQGFTAPTPTHPLVCP